jgi:hypothetical protein
MSSRAKKKVEQNDSTKSLCKFHCPCFLDIADRRQPRHCPPNKCSLLGQLHLVIDTLFFLFLSRASHYFRLHIYLHNHWRIFCASGMARTEQKTHATPRDSEHITQSSSVSANALALTLFPSLFNDAFIFAKSVLTSFMIRSA